jgi:transcriptional regulator with PAS, ATPase and Fis domain
MHIDEHARSPVGIEALARDILDHLNQPVLMVNRAYEIVYANAALAEQLHAPLDAVIGRPCYAVTHRSSEPCGNEHGSICPVREAFETGKRASSIHRHLYGGKLVVEEIVATPLAGMDLVIEELRDMSHLLGLVNGLLPICSSCKRIRDEKGNWQEVEGYVAHHTGADFTHGLCRDCLERLYPGLTEKT